MIHDSVALLSAATQCPLRQKSPNYGDMFRVIYLK